MDASKAERSEIEEPEGGLTEAEAHEAETPEAVVVEAGAAEPEEVEAESSELAASAEEEAEKVALEDSEMEVVKDEAPEPAKEGRGLTILKKVLLWAAIVVAAVFLLLGLAGIVGVWVVNTPVTETILAILEPIDNTLQRLEVISGEAGVALTEVSTSLNEADERVNELGAGLSQTNLVREALNQILEVDLEEKADKAGQGVRSIYDTLVAIEETVNAINAIPFLDVEVPGSTEIAGIRTGMEEMAASVDELREENQRRREERAENLVTAISTPLNRLNDRVDQLQTRMTNSEARFGQAVENMDVLQGKVPRWIDIASIVASLLLAWLAFSQGAVIVLCWRALHDKPQPVSA